MPGKRPPLFADYLHFVKDGRFYRLSFHTRAGVQEYGHHFTGEAVDKIRAHERKKRKKLTVIEWTQFFMEL
jgi:hypothetical protein